MPSANARRRLLNALHAIADATTLRAVGTVAAAAARDLAEADGADCIVREGTLCHHLAEEGVGPQLVGRKLPLATCVAGRALAFGQDVAIDDTSTLAGSEIHGSLQGRIASLMVVPDRATTPGCAIGVYWTSSAGRARRPLPALRVLADSAAAARQRLDAWAESVGQDARWAEDVRMCAWTRRLHLDGQWVTVETFLLRRFGLRVTHGISDEARNLLLGTRESE